LSPRLRATGSSTRSDGSIADGFDGKVDCTVEHVRTALAITERSIETLRWLAEKATEERSQTDKLRDKVLSKIEENGGRMTQREVKLKALRSMRDDDLKNKFLKSMVLDGELEASEEKVGATKQKTTVYHLPSG
jgi:hypothetical protein